MCTGLEIAALAASLAGTGIGVAEQQRALRAQDREAARGILQQAELTRQASQRVGDTVRRIEQSSPDSAITERRAAYIDALRRAQPASEQSLPSVGGVSQRFAEDVAAARAASAAEAANTAGLTARIDAPAVQRLGENQLAADTASQLSLLDDRSRHLDYLTRLRASMKQPNPWVLGAGQALSAFGSGLAMNAGGGATTPQDRREAGLVGPGRLVKKRPTRGLPESPIDSAIIPINPGY